MKPIIVLLLILPNFCVVAQSKKNIKKFNIRVQVETVQEGNLNYKSEQTVYDNNGNETEWIKYNKDGSIKRKRITKYNKQNDPLEILEYEGNQMTRKTVFEYNNFNEKISEITYDGNNQIIKKEIFTYNNKGLKSEKKVYDKNNQLISTHTYQYYTSKNKTSEKSE